jgi:hypothetical protein
MLKSAIPTTSATEHTMKSSSSVLVRSNSGVNESMKTIADTGSTETAASLRLFKMALFNGHPPFTGGI